jgi:hypothetical protein
MNGDLSPEGFDHIYFQGLQGYNMSSAHHLLMLDPFSGHLSSALSSVPCRRRHIAVIPRGFTKEFQPLDAGIN